MISEKDLEQEYIKNNIDIIMKNSKENNYDALAYETVCSEVTMGENPYKASDFHIRVADRSEVSQLVTV